MEKQFYYLEGKEQKGPFSLFELKSKGLSLETLVWSEGFETWKPIKELPDIFESSSKIPPPLPPPSSPQTYIKAKSNFWSAFKFVLSLLVTLGLATLVVFILLNNKKEEQKKDIHNEIEKVLGNQTAILDGVLELADGVIEETGFTGKKNNASENNWEKDGLYTVFKTEVGGFTVKKLTRLNDDGFNIETYISGDMGFKKPEFSYHSPRYIDDFMGGKIQMDQGYKTKVGRLPVRKCFNLAFDYFTKEDKKFPGAYKAGKFADISIFPELSNDYFFLENTTPKRVSSEGNNLASWSTSEIEESIDNEDWIVYYNTEGKHYELTLDKKAVKNDIKKNLGIAYGIVVFIFLMTLTFIKR